jgi:hypothetical protein
MKDHLAFRGSSTVPNLDHNFMSASENRKFNASFFFRMPVCLVQILLTMSSTDGVKCCVYDMVKVNGEFQELIKITAGIVTAVTRFQLFRLYKIRITYYASDQKVIILEHCQQMSSLLCFCLRKVMRYRLK